MQRPSASDTSTVRSITTGRLFRVFVSSTFADLRAERDALRNKVFPRLQQLCVERGAHFQAVDLRWGVSEEAALDQQAVAVCLEEIARCRRSTPRPNFVLLLGERYGWRPLPAQVPTHEMVLMLPHLDRATRRLVRQWYVVDRNTRRVDELPVSSAYVLQPREEELAAEELWRSLERRMREALAEASVAAGLNTVARRRFTDSVTEQEIIAGVFRQQGAQQHVHCFFRTTGVASIEGTGPAFLDTGADRVDLARLKNELRAFLGEDHIHEHQSSCKHGATSGLYLEDLCASVYTALAAVIEDEVSRDQGRDPLTIERYEHRRFGDERSRFFVGRTEILRKVADYVAGDFRCSPLALVGPSGVGKTALVAHAATAASDSQPDSLIVACFVGATARSAGIRTLLQDLIVELRLARTAEKLDLPNAYTELVDAFKGEIAHDRHRRIVLFVDALDQLDARANEVDLSWLPFELAPNVRIVVSASEGVIEAQLRRRLPSKRVVRLRPMSKSDAARLLDAWLADAGRSLRGHQRAEVLRSFAATGLPLHLRLAFEQARRWSSYSPREDTRLGNTVSELIRAAFARLAEERNNGRALVARSLAFLAASRNGLTETELLDLLSGDDVVMRDFRKRSPHSPDTATLPYIIWSRLFHDLAPYLNERQADGQTLFGFYHRQLAQVATEDYLAGDEAQARHAALAAYFDTQTLETPGPGGTVPNLRKLSELPFQQTHAALWDDLFATLTDFEFLKRKANGFAADEYLGPNDAISRIYPGVYLLQNDYELALREWPREDARPTPASRRSTRDPTSPRKPRGANRVTQQGR